MSGSVLIIDSDAERRRQVVAACQGCGIACVDVDDAFAALAVLGREELSAVLAAEGRRHVSLRGLCLLARKRHPGILLYVLLRQGNEADVLRSAVSESVAVLPASTSPTSIAQQISAALHAPMEPGAAAPAGDPLAAAELPARPADEGAFRSLRPARLDDFLLEGSLEEGGGAALLVAIFAQELTGRLSLVGHDEVSALYFQRGEPVWADHARGDPGIYERLVGTGHLDPNLSVRPVPEGHLLASLVKDRHLANDAVHEFMRGLLRDSIVALALQRQGAYAFREDHSILGSAPLLKLNPFGVVLDARRQGMTPDRLLAIGHELEERYVIPGPALGVTAPKIAPFLGDRDLAQLIDGTTTAAAFMRQTGLDLLMGTLILLTLEDARLVALSDAPAALPPGPNPPHAGAEH